MQMLRSFKLKGQSRQDLVLLQNAVKVLVLTGNPLLAVLAA